MNKYLVLISRHFYEDNFTTQFAVDTIGSDIGSARNLVRLFYPMEYRRDDNLQRLVAYFTGAITLV